MDDSDDDVEMGDAEASGEEEADDEEAVEAPAAMQANGPPPSEPAAFESPAAMQANGPPPSEPAANLAAVSAASAAPTAVAAEEDEEWYEEEGEEEEEQVIDMEETSDVEPAPVKPVVSAPTAARLSDASNSSSVGIAQVNSAWPLQSQHEPAAAGHAGVTRVGGHAAASEHGQTPAPASVASQATRASQQQQPSPQSSKSKQMLQPQMQHNAATAGEARSPQGQPPQTQLGAAAGSAGRPRLPEQPGTQPAPVASAPTTAPAADEEGEWEYFEEGEEEEKVEEPEEIVEPEPALPTPGSAPSRVQVPASSHGKAAGGSVDQQKVRQPAEQLVLRSSPPSSLPGSGGGAAKRPIVADPSYNKRRWPGDNKDDKTGERFWTAAEVENHGGVVELKGKEGASGGEEIAQALLRKARFAAMSAKFQKPEQKEVSPFNANQAFRGGAQLQRPDVFLRVLQQNAHYWQVGARVQIVKGRFYNHYGIIQSVRSHRSAGAMLDVALEDGGEVVQISSANVEDAKLEAAAEVVEAQFKAAAQERQRAAKAKTLEHGSTSAFASQERPRTQAAVASGRPLQRSTSSTGQRSGAGTSKAAKRTQKDEPEANRRISLFPTKKPSSNKRNYEAPTSFDILGASLETAMRAQNNLEGGGSDGALTAVRVGGSAAAASASPSASSSQPAAKKKKDENAPKRPTSSYFFYNNERRASLREEQPHLKFGEAAAVISAEWKAMAALQRSRFEQMAAEDQARYRREMAAYEAGTPLPPANAQPAAANATALPKDQSARSRSKPPSRGIQNSSLKGLYRDVQRTASQR
eukprot:TRINITY_DN10847_c0_g1_i1.p1 TRINITY_DN10847_c0_g1~~TRINITY_DN10847_c0_g1_i1.p1  ORF type:complete len:809 (+),score=252.56 TRINITY_DN10847_c0_g1_i1:101-2527(+)